MARQVNKLTDRQVKAETKAGRLGDGGGLFLRTKETGAKSWSFKWKQAGRQSELAIGPYPEISLAKARTQATKWRSLIAEGGNPKAEKAKTSEPTFAECAAMYLEIMEGQWSNAKHRQQWHNTLEQYCRPIAKRMVSEIELVDVLGVLNPIWNKVPETASRLRGRIEKVLSFAQTRGWRTSSNPAVWRGNLENVLPKPKKLINGHHAAMAWEDVPNFIGRLATHEALAARALELLIYTACRSGEVLEARWDEFDLEQGLWVIPASRMKARKEHRIPLTQSALDILKPIHEMRHSEWVFAGQSKGKPLSNMAMQQLLKRMKVTDITPHGFRSSFRDWAGDQTSFPREICEMCLAHTIGNKAEQAYRRSDALEKRRALLTAWEAHCRGNQSNNVVVLHG
ncbi:MAG: integrase arm-type DNA-binding domain-containing protein [Hyphomicrobiales bacterium]